MVHTRNGKKVRHGGDSDSMRPGGSGPMKFRATELYAGIGGWKGARRSGTGTNDTNTNSFTTEPVKKKARTQKPWDNEPGTKRTRNKNLAWRGNNGRHMDNYKRDHEFSFSGDDEVNTDYNNTLNQPTAQSTIQAIVQFAAQPLQSAVNPLQLTQGWLPGLPPMKDTWCDP